MCQNRKYAALFDHLVGNSEQSGRERQAERLRSLKVDDKLGFNLSAYLDGDWIFAPSRASMRPRILTLNDFAPSTNSTRTIRDGVGTIRVLDGPGNRIALSKAGPV